MDEGIVYEEIKLSGKKEEELLAQARKHYKMLETETFANKESFKENIKFAFNIGSGHWNQDDIDSRDNSGRPHLTSNKLAKFVAQVVNLEKSTPNVDEIIPVDDKSDVALAKVLNDIIIDIEYQSEADVAYNLAGEHAVGGGFGYWRIITEYTDEGFDQEIKIKKIENPLSVAIDRKGNFAFVREAYTEEEFKELYPEEDMSNFDSYEDMELWYADKKVYVAEYFCKKQYTKEIAEVYNPETQEVMILELTDENRDEIKKSYTINQTRKKKSHKIMWYKMTGTKILETREWPGKYIPIVEVVGHQVHLEGVNYKMSLIHNAKDMNRGYDYWLTAATEKGALWPKSPYMVTPQQIGAHKAMWDNANNLNTIYLFYEQTAAGKPERAQPPTIDAAAMTMLQIFDNDIKDTLGMYESAVGDRSNERSGKAIIARNARSDQSTFTFPDNLRRAKLQTKRILLDLIPKIYDNARIIRLRSTDEVVKINFPMLVDGKKVLMNDLSKGRYDYRVKNITSPSRRQQVADFISQLLQYAPKEYAGPLLTMAMQFIDVPGAMEVTQMLQGITDQIKMQAQAQASGQSPLSGAKQTAEMPI